MTAWIRFRHSIEGVLVGELESVMEDGQSGQSGQSGAVAPSDPTAPAAPPAPAAPIGSVYVFAKNCRDAETGKKASWERTGVALSAVIGVEKGPAP